LLKLYCYDAKKCEARSMAAFFRYSTQTIGLNRRATPRLIWQLPQANLRFALTRGVCAPLFLPTPTISSEAKPALDDEWPLTDAEPPLVWLDHPPGQCPIMAGPCLTRPAVQKKKQPFADEAH
jgi:hypothetical protein